MWQAGWRILITRRLHYWPNVRHIAIRWLNKRVYIIETENSARAAFCCLSNNTLGNSKKSLPPFYPFATTTHTHTHSHTNTHKNTYIHTSPPLAVIPQQTPFCNLFYTFEGFIFFLYCLVPNRAQLLINAALVSTGVITD